MTIQLMTSCLSYTSDLASSDNAVKKLYKKLRQQLVGSSTKLCQTPTWQKNLSVTNLATLAYVNPKWNYFLLSEFSPKYLRSWQNFEEGNVEVRTVIKSGKIVL